MIIAGVLVIILSGGPRLALQTIAWTRMLVAYSQQDGLVRGVTKTFDGQHPCSLCKSIVGSAAQERTTQTGQAKFAPTETIWMAVVSDSAPRLPVFASDRFEVTHETCHGLVHSPPTPPPEFSASV
jgi:hypothetical protein